ncbi:hypothetical protein G6F22_012590 [Rhizopus arrhizus]|nr:hypothetical protein G6F22_012590 [Rhizopus arrhizus]
MRPAPARSMARRTCRVSAAGEVALGNAATATKLATTRLFSVTGGATAGGVSFDGSGNVALNVTALDVSKANAGTLPVARGGTGVATVAAGSNLAGAGAGALVPRTPAEVLDDIQALPKAGGNVSGPIVLGAGATVGSQYGSNATSGQTAQIVLPDGGGFSTHTATVVGAMKITLPPAAVGVNTMIRMRVDVFEYAAAQLPVSVLLHGYVQTTKAWTRCAVTLVAGRPVSDLPVRFGSDAGGNLCIWLGDTNRSWSYPTVSVSEVLAKARHGIRDGIPGGAGEQSGIRSFGHCSGERPAGGAGFSYPRGGPGQLADDQRRPGLCDRTAGDLGLGHQCLLHRLPVAAVRCSRIRAHRQPLAVPDRRDWSNCAQDRTAATGRLRAGERFVGGVGCLGGWNPAIRRPRNPNSAAGLAEYVCPIYRDRC